jgi:Uncharacterized conserved protein
LRRGLGEIVGGDGLLTLVLSNVVILATAGVSLFVQLARVHRVARATLDGATSAELAIVLGFRLRWNGVCPEYARRLERARRLLADRRVRRILIVGGRTGTAAASEADAGRRFLADCGVPSESILLEEQSRHTLENLRHARAALNLGTTRFVLITSRYHLARSVTLAEGLDLRPLPCAAEERLTYDPSTLFRLAREAYFLHWYHVGKTWSQWTGNTKSMARIS